MSNQTQQETVIRSIRQWQTRLLQLDRRNVLLYFPQGTRGVKLTNFEPEPMLEWISSARLGRAFTYAERVRTGRGDRWGNPIPGETAAPEAKIRITPGELQTDLQPLDLQKRLEGLHRRYREWQEEQGINILYVALGFLNWLDENQEPACSPILLVPCDLSRVSPRDPYLLTVDESDDPIVNPTLRHKLLADGGVALPEFGEEMTIELYLSAVEGLVAGHQEWSVERTVVFSAFPFSKLPMWQDLDLMASSGISHPMVRLLGGDKESEIPQPFSGAIKVPKDDDELRGAGLDSLLDIRDQYAVMDADFSQLRAIELARSGGNLVIHGPPGTGKSQTIANIIATLLADGKRVLFVSEKTAALDVVKRRLADVGLGNFCLDLHSDRGKKASVYAQLRASFEMAPAKASDFRYDRLASRRDTLNTIVRALHTVRQPLGRSVFDIHGHLASIADAPRLHFAIRDIGSLDDERLFRIRDAARRLSLRTREFAEHHSSRWRPLGSVVASPGLADLVRNELDQIGLALNAVTECGNRIATDCGVTPPATLADTSQIARLLAHLTKQPALVPAQWFAPGGLARAESNVMTLRAAISERSSITAELLPWLGGARPGPRSSEWLSIAEGIANEAPRWDQIAGPTWTSDIVTNPQATAARWRAISGALDALSSSLARLQSLLGYRQSTDTRAAAEEALALAAKLAEFGPVPSSWNSEEAIREIRAQLATAKCIRDELVEAEYMLASRFTYAIVKQVDEDMLVRYKTDHRSIWRSMRKAFRRDQRVVQGCLKQPGKLSVAEATAAVEQALTAGHTRARWLETADKTKGMIGGLFTGIESDWTGIASLLEAVESIYRNNLSQLPRLSSILTDLDKLIELKASAQVVREQLKEIDTIWLQGASRGSDQLLALSSDANAYANSASKTGEIMAALGPFLKLPTDLRAFISLLRAGTRLEPIESQEVAENDSRVDALGPPFRGWSTDMDGLQCLLDWTQALIATLPGPVPDKLAQTLTLRLDVDLFATAEIEITNSIKRARTECAAATKRFPEDRLPWGSWDRVPLTDAIEWCEELGNHAEEASDWADYRSAAEALDDSVGTGATDALRVATEHSTAITDIVLRHVLISWLDRMYRDDPTLQFAPRDLGGVIREFRDLDAGLPVAARERVRAKCLAALDGIRPMRGMGETGVLARQLAMKRRQMPARKLFATIPTLVQKLKPCFMMSPLAVSQYLPHGESLFELSFDSVIFDEASQVFPEDAVPAIARGRQTIVVGDQKQLPPSSFFRSNDADDDSNTDEDSEEIENNMLVDVESILDVMVGMRVSGIDDVHLQVHYRSQHDSLIRFSNNKFYEDRLLTFPSAHMSGPGLGVRSIYLPNGRFESGGSRTNRIEAERVVQTVFELMGTQPPHESIGVVALSRAQADLIQELIDARRLTDRMFDDRFAEDKPERFFVKNLENVQGDERDHVILSVGYGPTVATGLVPNRFGPINIEGGQRRLNVAISRARKSMTVIHSMLPSDIRSEKQGARLLRQYLEFAANGEASIEGAVGSSPSGDSESPFEEAVGNALKARGHRIQRQVGCAKYSIDIVILSEDGREFDLAIECDGATYHRSPSARDRDRLRQEILERLGWRGRIHRVWSTAWIRNPKAEMEAIEDALGTARAMLRKAVTAPSVIPDEPTEIGIAESEAGNAIIAQYASPATAQLAFSPYVTADLSRFPLTVDLREEKSENIAELVVEVVAVEGPVHIDLVVERVRSHFGLQRSGNLVQNAVMRGVKAAVKSGTVTWLPLADTIDKLSRFLVLAIDTLPKPRSVSAIGTVRDIDEISDQEIDAGLFQVLRMMVGGPREEVTKATARAFGFGRNGQHVDERLSSVIVRLLASNKLINHMGSLALSDTEGRR